MCDICFCIAWQTKSTSILAHRPGVCHSSPFCDNLHFEQFVKRQPQMHGECFDELFEMEIVHKMGTSGMRLTSTDSIRVAMCNISFCISWPEKSQHASSHYATDSIRKSMCDICFCICWPRKITTQHASSHYVTESIRQSMCDICFCISWPRKVNMHHRTSTDSIRNQPSATHRRFYKPAFSRFSQNCEPLIVVEIFGKIVKRQVCQKRR